MAANARFPTAVGDLKYENHQLVCSAAGVRKQAAEQGIAEEEALKNGMEENFREFTEKGSVLYAKA